MRGLIVWVCITGVLAGNLAGCGDTADQITAMDLDLAARRATAAGTLADRLIKDPDLQKVGDVQLYVSSNLVGQALTLFDGLTITLPDAPGITLKVNSIRPSFSEGLASINLDLSATKGSMSIQIQGTATLIPETLPDALIEKNIEISIGKLPDFLSKILGVENLTIPITKIFYRQKQPLRFRIAVDHIAPRASWGPFSTDIKGFVADLTRLKLNELISAKLPAIEVPLMNVIAIVQESEKKPLVLIESKLKGELNTPAVSWSTSFSLTEVVVLKRGIHLVGMLSNPGDSQ
jgi:hypothetical protein